MELGHLPVMPDEVLGTLAPAPGSLQIDATVGGGGHTERILEAANPDGRVLGLDADQAAIDRVARAAGRVRRPARPAPGELPRAGGGRARGRLRRRRRGAVRPRAVELPARGPRAGLRLPHRRPARHALRHDARRAGLGAARDPRRRRARRPVPALRRGAVRVEDRQGDRGGPGDGADRDRGGPRAADRDRLARQPAPATAHPPGHPRVPGAADRGQRGARRAVRRGSPPPSTCCGRAAASSSCPTTRSRTASSSASSPPSGAAAPARPRCPCASAATPPACAS